MEAGRRWVDVFLCGNKPGTIIGRHKSTECSFRGSDVCCSPSAGKLIHYHSADNTQAPKVQLLLHNSLARNCFSHLSDYYVHLCEKRHSRANPACTVNEQRLICIHQLLVLLKKWKTNIYKVITMHTWTFKATLD